jgi:uncharacterized membrane protein YraQ (UPF0718 family)
MNAFEWLNATFLKMDWLESFIQWIFQNLFQLEPNTQLYDVLTFFVFDTIKIFILLIALIFLVSFIQSYFSPERTRDLLKPYQGVRGNTMGALLGTLTPFCSCSSIPLFIGFTKAGLPIGMTFSFLISSPLVDLASVILLASIFGWPIALIYVALGLVIAILGGTLIQRLKMERYLATFLIKPYQNPSSMMTEAQVYRKGERIQFALDQVKSILQRVYPYVLIGVGIGALIHGVIPQPWIEAWLGQNKWYAVPLATLVGVPMYADIFGTLPIASSLLDKGVGVGTVISFIMAITALSLPSLVLLKKVVKKELLVFFIGYLVVSIILIGYFLNWIQPWILGGS